MFDCSCCFVLLTCVAAVLAAAVRCGCVLWRCVCVFVLQVQVLADPNQSFTRMLGLELTGAEGPPSQRYAGVVDGGILLRLVSQGAA